MKKSQEEKENKFKNIFSAWLSAQQKGENRSVPVDEDTAALEALRLCLSCSNGRKALLAAPSYGIAEQMAHELKIWAEAAEVSLTAALLPEGSWRDTVTLDCESARAELLERMTGRVSGIGNHSAPRREFSDGETRKTSRGSRLR